MTDTMYVVVIHYSFDADVPVFWFKTEQDCKEFIKYEFEKEKRLTVSDIESTFISDDGEYASITYVDNEHMDWNLTYVTDKRSEPVKWIEYTELSVEAKLHCIEVYMNRIVPYENWENVNDISDIEIDVREMLMCSEYTIDTDGNWYDECGRLI